MNEPIATAIPTCATCRHKVYRDREHVICYGAPPTPVPIAGGKNLAGQDVIRLEMIRPQPRANERACAVYQAQDAQEQPATDIPADLRADFSGIDLAALGRRKPS